VRSFAVVSWTERSLRSDLSSSSLFANTFLRGGQQSKPMKRDGTKLAIPTYKSTWVASNLLLPIQLGGCLIIFCDRLDLAVLQ
jgi:hypothetical protein